MEKQKLKAGEYRILKTLLEHDYELSTTEVAEMTGMSWNTVKRYLDKFHDSGWIEESRVGNREYWRAYRQPKRVRV